MGDQPTIALIKTSPEEERVKRYVLSSMENLSLLMKDIQMNMMELRIDHSVVFEFKASLLEIYFYYARSKIRPLGATSQEKKEKYEVLFDLDFYVKNPQELGVEDAFSYAMLIREMMEDLEVFTIEKAQVIK